MTQDLTARALFRAVQQRRPAPGLIHHSDRGSQYCALAYRQILDQFGVQALMSRKGNCYDNAPMASFWGSLKNELVHHQRYATRAQAEASIREYIEIFYNRRRRHSRLGYLAPQCLHRISADSRPPLEAGVSIIDSTPHKLKPLLDAEARVVGHVPGKGRLSGMLGALRVETPAGVRFELGSGFSDAERRDPPPLGALVTYQYRSLSRDGVPRFASYQRRREAF